MTYPNGRIIEKDFDLLDRVSKIKQGQDNIADFSYIGRSYRVLSKQFGNGDAINYLYDLGRRMHTKETKNKNSDLINRYVYGHNRVHMKTYEQRGHHNNAGDVYTYDDVYRLTNVKINVPDPTVPNPTEFEKEKTFNFDKLDNIMSIVETQNEQTTTKTTQINPVLNQYENFDGWGLSYDLNGNTTQKGTQHFTYNYRNQVIKAQDQTSEANYKYDALGRRIQKAVTVGSTTKTTNYYYSGNHVIEERDGSDNVLKQYIYGTGIDDILRMDNYSGATATPYYFHTNDIGSVTAITDANGDIVERVSYDVFGMPTFTDDGGEVVSKSTIGNTLLFHGRRYDAETNLYYYRARYYDPIMGRFLQTDPMGYYDSMNLYQGFNMNPINFLDPFGENVYVEVTPSGSGSKEQLTLGEFWYALRKDYSREDAAKILMATEGYGDISEEQIIGLEFGAMTKPFEVYVGGAALIMFEFSPAGVFKDIVSLPFGKDLVSGEKLKWWQKGLIAAPFLAKAAKVLKVGKLFGFGEDLLKSKKILPLDNLDNVKVLKKGNTISKVKKSVFEIVDPKYRKMVSEAFEGEPKLIKLKEDLIVYRRWGGTSKEVGSRWFSLKPYKRAGNAKRYTALPELNTAENITKFKIPAGTTILKGKTGSQVGIPGFGNYATGQGIQIYVPDPSVAIKIQ